MRPDSITTTRSQMSNSSSRSEEISRTPHPRSRAGSQRLPDERGRADVEAARRLRGDDDCAARRSRAPGSPSARCRRRASRRAGASSCSARPRCRSAPSQSRAQPRRADRSAAAAPASSIARPTSSPTALLDRQRPSLLRSNGMIRSPPARRAASAVRRSRRCGRREAIVPRGDRREVGDGAHQRPLAVALDAGDADDLARARRPATRRRAAVPSASALRVDVLQLEDRAPPRPTAG